jgi:hypothetical protein
VGCSEHMVPAQANMIMLGSPLESMHVTRVTGQGNNAV